VKLVDAEVGPLQEKQHSLRERKREDDTEGILDAAFAVLEQQPQLQRCKDCVGVKTDRPLLGTSAS
jgi:hypothetical protein